MQTNFISVTEFCKKHGLDRANAIRFIKAGRIPAEKVGNQYIIPADAPKPEDKRVKSGKYKNWRKKPSE